ncbi:Bladder cancer-related BC10-like protein [Kalmanozyma brasiliensis GHG001]|uniref:Bladder cancer-related BC10-like protein n=1 Tax=Kalmanozyma brasiliensis (strain GHG001) TaxID=1365824 RepID=UPI002867D0AA|nr:Bladder cancer-related BC10-like protein [Kalmanozyma brasiliensis GHG001]KAF6767016.1 Bladder cancer-related BC10-like protein [Kalmanozyma brasiliensis GHG001]
MYCLRWWIPLFLLPFPKTSPLFLVLFLFSFALHSQPCMYCALILMGLFGTSSNWYTSDASAIVSLSANSSASVSPSNTTSARSSYGWLDLGFSGGNGFFSPLTRPIIGSSADVDSLASSQQSDFYRLSIPWSESRVEIPKRFFVGLGKHQGFGVWVDLGSGLDITTAPLATKQSTSSHAYSIQHTEL